MIRKSSDKRIGSLSSEQCKPLISQLNIQSKTLRNKFHFDAM